MRPLTFGELLDAAVSLLRVQWPLLLVSAAVLAMCEQAVLYPLRAWAGTDPPLHLPGFDRIGPTWLAFCAGLASEGAILALLGGLAGVAAGPGLLGQPAGWRHLLRQAVRRLPALLVVAAVTAAILLPAALFLMLPWLFLFGLVGLAAPALVVDRIGPARALGRSFRLASVGLRGAAVRLGGYCSWAAIRLVLGSTAYGLLQVAVRPGTIVFTLLMLSLWVLVDAVAYATLACIDAVLYLETRMRVEGLDIAIGRIRRLGRPVDLAGSAILGAAR
ncbi:hypothetical protein GCM10007977_040140 [Dactylosporangium sucinum]|uniref:Uncharacterized protein n=2 Tax=Dactylosporangium sucinum TaxID=1424081 RepID=A0A917TRE6_9ACTN|nr:hypothetical protein GCM10007977_040140 [Dactylosporangium sucinum]